MDGKGTTPGTPGNEAAKGPEAEALTAPEAPKQGKQTKPQAPPAKEPEVEELPAQMVQLATEIGKQVAANLNGPSDPPARVKREKGRLEELKHSIKGGRFKTVDGGYINAHGEPIDYEGNVLETEDQDEE